MKRFLDEILQFMYNAAALRTPLSPLATAEPHLHLAEMALQMDNIPVAQMHAEDALGVDPQCARAWWVLGMTYDAQRQLDEAAWAYIRALRLAHKSAARASLGCLAANTDRSTIG